MKKNLKLLISSALSVLTFSMQQEVLGMEDSSNTLQSRAKQEIFEIRESMIDECINQYKILTSPTLTYGELADACLKLNPLYKERQKLNKERSIEDGRCDLVMESWYCTPGGSQWATNKAREPNIINKLVGAGGIKEAWMFMLYVSSIRVDVIDNMELYEKVKGAAHPRWDEFNQAYQSRKSEMPPGFSQ